MSTARTVAEVEQAKGGTTANDRENMKANSMEPAAGSNAPDVRKVVMPQHKLNDPIELTVINR